VKRTTHELNNTRPFGPGTGLAAVFTVFALAVAGSAGADNQRTLGDAVRNRPVAYHTGTDAGTDASGTETAAARLADQWGIEVTSIRRTAHDHMVDFRYRVLDVAKAEALFNKATKPSLIHQRTGKVLAVPVTAKIGPLRSSYKPQKDRIYWMFFGNPGLVKAGDKVTVVIGAFRATDLVVE